jgi:hypothetical protein
MREQLKSLKYGVRMKNYAGSRIFPLVLSWCAALCGPAEAQQVGYMYDPSGNLVSSISSLSIPLSLIAQPQSQLLESNAPVTFSVVATGAGLTYQWLSNGVAIAGATGDSLLLANLSGPTSASYSVVISNVSGAITSSPVAVWTDSNGTGMPDWWQLQYFGNLNQIPTGDYDGDGVDNLDEYLEGTNPTNAASFDPRLYVQSVNGIVAAVPSQPYYLMGQIVTLTAIPDAGQTFLNWGGDIAGTKTNISLVMNTNKSITAVAGLSLPVALDNAILTWTTGGAAPWFGQTQFSEDGLGAAQSGSIEDGDQSWLQTVTSLTEPMQLSFWWSVSSQPSDGELNFAIDGTTILSISGTTGGWQNVKSSLPTGQHTLLWTYEKFGGQDNLELPLIFEDAGWVDEVVLTPANVTTNSPVLSIAFANSNAVTLSWPAPSTGFILQQNSSLETTNWVNETNPTNVIGDQNEVSVTPAGSNQFFRLKL